METLKPQETLDEGLVKSEMGDARNPCNEVIKEVSKVAISADEFTGQVSPSSGQTLNHCDEVSVEVPEFAGSVEKLSENVSLSSVQPHNDFDEIPEFGGSVEKLTEQVPLSLGQTHNHCDEIPVEDPEFAASTEKYTGLMDPSLDETQNPCDAMFVEVPEFSVSVEKLTYKVLPSLAQTQNHFDESHVEDPELAASNEKLSGPVSPLLDDIQNPSDAMLVEVSEVSVSVEKITDQTSPSLSQMQNHCDEVPVEDPELATFVDVPEFSVPAEKLMEQVAPSLGEMQNHYDEVPVEKPQFAASTKMNSGPVFPSLDESHNHCDAISVEVEVPDFSVSDEKPTEQQNHCDEVLEFSVSDEELTKQQNHCDELLDEVCEYSVPDEKLTEQMSPLAGSAEGNVREVDSDNKVELPRRGISLFVELNDRVPGCTSIDSGKSVLPEKSLSNGSLLQACGNLSTKLWNEADGGESVIDEGYRFNNMGDLVWAKNKTQLWLPGIICDPLSVPKEARKTEAANCLLVKCFRNAIFVWCRPSQLKPFIEFFEQMSKQIISKSFFVALEKATAEIGRRVKMEMTCPCYSNGTEDKRGNASKFSVTQFEPASFIARIKSLSLDVSGHDKIECTLIQNQLSAFYRSIGHHQIPLHQLKPANEGKDEELTKLFGEDPNTENKKRSSKSSKSFSLENGDRSSDGKSGRERKKSKYLSYPYVKLGRKGFEEDEIDDPKEVSPVGMDKKSIQPVGPPSSVNGDVKKSPRKWSNSGTTGNDALGKTVEINLSASEVLSELQRVAIDCLYPRGSKQFGVAENYILGYRKKEYQDYYSELASDRTVVQEFDPEVIPSETLAEVQVHADKGMANSIGVAGENQVPQFLLNVLSRKRGRRKKENLSDSKTSLNPILPGVEVSSDNGILNSVEMAVNDLVKQPLVANTVPKKRGRKKMEKLSESSPNLILPYPTNAPMMLDFQNVANQGLQEIEVMPSNDNTTILNFEGSQVVGPPLGKLQPKRRKKEEGGASNMAKPDSVLQEVQVMGPSMVQTFPDLNNKGVKEPASFHLNFEAKTCYTDITGNTAGQSQMGILSPCSGADPTKRKRKEKASESQNNVAPPISDLNGIGSDGKSQKKRRKRIFKAEACIDYSKLQNNGEVSGPALLLKFAAGEPVPSKEALVSAFRGFGPLKELETRPLENSDIAVVVFEINSNALNAFRGLEKNSPFGPSLVNFQLHNFSGEASKGLEGNNNKIPSGKLSGGKPQKKEAQNKPQQREAQNLPGIRKNLEMMTSMLKKSGPNLYPEMRAKLEREVNGLLEKVSEMVANSSSS